MKRTTSATPNRSKNGRKMRQHNRALKVVSQVESYRNNINKLFARAGISSYL